MSMVNFPVLLPSSWAKAIFAKGGHLLLAGGSLDNPQRFRETFSLFWERYQLVRPEHHVFGQNFDRSFLIPYAIHGDEGRGKNRRPIMIESLQPIISWKGREHTNASGHPFKPLTKL